jgi:ataxia telangiectasia mutated family protein
VQSQSSITIRAYQLQILLFFINRHWSVLHDGQQVDIINALLKFVSFEDVIIQSWTFLCLAAIADADGSSRRATEASSSATTDRTHDVSVWDPVWTHAIRRSNSIGICRAACHVAYILLSNSKRFLASQRVLLEIETLAKDLDIQGPMFPYDSVCMFFSRCLQVASQDVRLYRMRLEEKVLSWLMDNWKVGDSQGNGERSRLQPHMVGDVLLLLESICGFSKRSDTASRILLPDCSIVDAMVEQRSTKVIQDFLLCGTLPPFQSSSERCAGSGNLPTVLSGSIANEELAPPRGRERRISAFLQKSLETLTSEFDIIRGANGHPTSEQARRALDLAFVAMSFESLLLLNGTLSNSRVIQCACKLLTLVTPLLLDSRWTLAEKALVVIGLYPVISSRSDGNEDDAWIAMLPPSSDTGIRTETLRKLLSHTESHKIQQQAMNNNFQRVLLSSTNVRESILLSTNILFQSCRCKMLSAK